MFLRRVLRCFLFLDDDDDDEDEDDNTDREVNTIRESEGNHFSGFKQNNHAVLRPTSVTSMMFEGTGADPWALINAR